MMSTTRGRLKKNKHDCASGHFCRLQYSVCFCWNTLHFFFENTISKGSNVSLVDGKDFCMFLQTVFGKRLIYQSTPLALPFQDPDPLKRWCGGATGFFLSLFLNFMWKRSYLCKSSSTLHLPTWKLTLFMAYLSLRSKPLRLACYLLLFLTNLSLP